jgi:diguanylate cyclase
MRLWSEQGFEAHRAASERAVGLLYGALLVMALHNLYAAIMLREKAFAVHFLLLVSYLLYSMSLQGTAFQLLWPNATWWAVRSTIALQGIVIVCVFWFARLFLRTPDHAPRLDRVMQAFMVFGAVLSAANLAQYIWVNTMAHWGAAISVITIAAAAFYVYLQGFRPALTFLLAWFVSLAGAVSISLVGLKVLPQSFITENGMHIGIALAFLLFSFALTQRVRQAEADYRDRLESVVAERTQELKAALANVKTLKGLIPICCNCKKVRDDQGYWNQIEMYIADNSEADLTHGICPDCFEKLYGQDLQALRERAAKRSKGRDSDLRGAAEDLDEM